MRVPSFGRTLALARLAVFLIAAEVLVSTLHLVHDVGPAWGLRPHWPAFFDRMVSPVLVFAELTLYLLAGFLSLHVLWAIARRHYDAPRESTPDWSPTWVVRAFVYPLVNWVLPPVVLAEIWSLGTVGRSGEVETPPVFRVWYVAWLASSLVIQLLLASWRAGSPAPWGPRLLPLLPGIAELVAGVTFSVILLRLARLEPRQQVAEIFA